jgi:Protein of unknown function (DUF732)
MGLDCSVPMDALSLLGLNWIPSRRHRRNGNPAVRTGITSLADALVSASVVLTAAMICAGAAGADPSQQQDQFVALLAQDQIPLIDDLPALVARAHQICSELDGGVSVETVVNEQMNAIFEENPAYHQISNRVKRTAVRFIAVSADVYCPSHLRDPLEGDVGSDVGFSILGPVSGVRHPT